MVKHDIIQKKLSALRIQYINKLPERLQKLEQCWQGLDKDFNALSEFHREVHSLAGSGGTFGFSELSQTARILERTLFIFIKLKQTLSFEQKQHISLEFSQLSQAITHILKNEIQIETIPVDLNTEPSVIYKVFDQSKDYILLVEDDIAIGEKLSEQLQTFGYIVKIINNAEYAYNMVIKEKPNIIIIDIILPEGENAGLELAHTINQSFTIPIIFISSRSDVYARLQAVKAGGRIYLIKPVDANILIECLDKLTQKILEPPYRVLLVDDDITLSQQYALILENIGMQACICNNPLEIVEKLNYFHPDIILMDVYMPEYTGYELAQVIRQMDEFTAIPIVYLSTERSENMQLHALLQGGDDFLTKPIHPNNLIQVVQYRAMRFRQLHHLMTKDSLTHLLNHRHIKERLELEIKRNKILCFAMIDLDYFKIVNDNYGHAMGDQVLKTFSHFLQQKMRKTDIIGRYGGEEFALILPNTTVSKAQILCETLRQDFYKISHYHNSDIFNISFSCGIAEYPMFSNLKSLIDAADQALYASKDRGRNCITLAKLNT